MWYTAPRLYHNDQIRAYAICLDGFRTVLQTEEEMVPFLDEMWTPVEKATAAI